MKKKGNKTIKQLRRYESRNITFIQPDGSWPIVWERAKGMRVWDDAEREYLDFTAAFAVAAAGHANPRIVAAGQRQMARLLHAMGDVHPHALKGELACELSRITFDRLAKRTGKTIFCSSGFEAVEAALKTAHLATGRTRIIAFEDAYHGLGYGALNATWRSDFRLPFSRQIGEFGSFVPFPSVGADLAPLEQRLAAECRKHKVGAILVEPVQARGGTNIPPLGFLKLLRKVCDENGALLICDEVYTGFGRTGRWFASEHFGVTPDILCLGKALTGGFPLSACVGRADVMDRAWPESTGEAIHTSTFLGHPVGCAMALASLRELDSRNLPERSAEMGRLFLDELRRLAERLGRQRCRARGVGLMLALELFHDDGTPAADIVLGVIKQLLRDGFILLPEGDPPNILSFSPPLTVGKSHIRKLIRALGHALEEVFA
ncbi:MAG TPA: aspartate aminotransferase family protein [Verrucomicrobiota bacterium]|nr:aspartate aminotransferase family protein [Verrucomicrobiota bacterium]